MRAVISTVATASLLAIVACSRTAIPVPGPAAAARAPQLITRITRNPFRLVYSWQEDAEPFAGLTYVNGTFYGTTAYGGNGVGMIFSVTPAGVESALHTFDGYDGVTPMARLVALNGTLYGTTSAGGAQGDGTVFSVTTSGSFTLLHSFSGADGRDPMAGLTDVNGTLYGTTYYGGSHDAGTVFSISPSGPESVVYSFTGGGDGGKPRADLLDTNGRLYGTTSQGGTNGVGTVFRITPSGQERVLYSFGNSPDGAYPIGALVKVGGTFYGTTGAGGSNLCMGLTYCGTVFSLTPGGSERILHDFNYTGDGYFPFAGLVYANGSFYGTTEMGGLLGGGISYGTIYSITSSGAEKVLWSFENSGDGSEIVSPLLYVRGRLYGTAPLCGDLCGGSVFAVKP